MMFLLKLSMILVLAVCNKAFPSESEKECEGNTLCQIKTPDYPQAPRGEKDIPHHHRARRSNPCDSTTEEVTFTNKDPDDPNTLVNQLLTQKFDETRCVEEGAVCLQDNIYGRSYICETQYSLHMMTFGTVKISKKKKVGCACVEN